MQIPEIAWPAAGAGEGEPPWDRVCRDGVLGKEKTRELGELLSTFTQTPNVCWFCVWEGWGQLCGGGMSVVTEGGGIAVEPPAGVADAPRVRVPGRAYLLYRGPVSACAAFFDAPAWDEGASIWWPEDRAWCVASEIDLFETFVGAGEECISSLLGDDRFESFRTSVEAKLGADPVNPSPPQGARVLGLSKTFRAE